MLKEKAILTTWYQYECDDCRYTSYPKTSTYEIPGFLVFKDGRSICNKCLKTRECEINERFFMFDDIPLTNRTGIKLIVVLGRIHQLLGVFPDLPIEKFEYSQDMRSVDGSEFFVLRDIPPIKMITIWDNGDMGVVLENQPKVKSMIVG